MPVGKKTGYILIVLAAMFSQPSPVHGAEGPEAADAPGAEQLEPRIAPHLGTSYYLFEVNGVDVGTGFISLQREGDFYKIRYEARTNDRVDHVYKARYKGEGIMEIDPVKPIRAELYQRVRSKASSTSIYFEQGGRVIAMETKTEKGKAPKKKVRKTRAEGLVLDPLSAVFLLQGFSWELGKEKVLKVYTGKAHYELRFTCVDEVSLVTSGVKRNAWAIRQVARALEKSPEGQPEKKGPELMIYVSAEGYPDVLKVETVNKIGHITLTFSRFEPAPDRRTH